MRHRNALSAISSSPAASRARRCCEKNKNRIIKLHNGSSRRADTLAAVEGGEVDTRGQICVSAAAAQKTATDLTDKVDSSDEHQEHSFVVRMNVVCSRR